MQKERKNVVHVGRGFPAEQVVGPLTNQKGKEETYCWAKPNLQKQPRGFTLIELLVVVLIIGILAAVAVPQYKRTVDKAQLSTFFPAITSLLKAQKVYYLANGKYAAKVTDLDVDISNICPNLRGSTLKNDLYNCKFGYKIINAAINANESDKVLYLVLCPLGTNTAEGSLCGTENQIMRADFYFEKQGKVYCTHNGDRGKFLCKTILSHFNT